MTAEIVIGNGYGIVLSADTAVTHRFSRTYARTYDGARKLIGLPLPHCIGVLVAGNTSIHGIPYETYLENWLHSLPQQRLARLSDYADSFKDYLVKVIPEFQSDVDLCRTYIEKWSARLIGVRNRIERISNGISDDIVRAYFEEMCNEFDEDDFAMGEEWATKVWQVLGRSSIENLLEAEYREQGRDVRQASIEGCVDYYFSDICSPATIELINRWSRLILGLYYPRGSSSTIAFVGYGDFDILPSVVVVRPLGMMRERFFWGVETKIPARKSGSGFVLFETFGQDDEIERFLRESGMRPGHNKAIVQRSLSKKVARKADSEVEIFDEREPSNEAERKSVEEFKLLGSEISEEIEEIARKNKEHALASLAGMNLRNLALMTERLVGLQNLALDLREQLPTVGGILVTAIITMQHGFVFYNPDSDTDGVGTHVH